MSKFVVSARKYRPTAFDDVVGQNHVAQTLKNALQTDKLAHAFLFCGPRGVGKTTCARILAKVINCENPINKVQSCNECSSCLSFAENASFNIFELDAASNNSVEHIRNLIEQVRFQPQQGAYKIFIIDEVHMLSTQAFNAFLKTLEEPPPYAIFILATTEKHKILPTILSRCQIFDFKRIQPEDVVVQLEHICQAENREADKEALHVIAQKADGAMRDALSIFDKISSATEGKITYQDVVTHLNILDYDYFFRSIDACLRSDLTEVFLILDEVMKNGFDPEIYLHGLSDHIRDLLVSKDPKTIHLIEGSKDLKMRYYNQSSLAKSSFLLTALNMLNDCDITLSRVNNKRLQIELTLSKLAFLPHLQRTDVFNTSQGQEKKNSRLNQEQASNEDVNSTPPVAHEPTEVMAKAPAIIEDVSPMPPVAHEPTEVMAKAPTNNKALSPILAEDTIQLLTPNLNLPKIGALPSIEDIKNLIQKEENDQRRAQNNLSYENVKASWDAYIHNHSSNSFQTAVKPALLELEDKTIYVKVPSPVSKGYLQQETALMEALRDTFGTPDLVLKIEVNKDLFPDYHEEEREKTSFTNYEAFQEFASRNPNFQRLVDVLKLKIDDGHF